MMLCVQCSTELVAPERSKYRSNGHICHVWLCPKCSTRFESLVRFQPVQAQNQ
jgi:RNase P subunit RPR2